MKLVPLRPDQSVLMNQAMHAVVSAEGISEPSPIERDSIAAIHRHLFQTDEPPAPALRTLPQDLYAAMNTADLRQMTVRVLLMLPFVDLQVSAAKAQVVEHAARILDVQDPGLGILRHAVKRRYRLITLGILHRGIKSFWSGTGRASLRDWFDMAMVVLPVLTPGRRKLRDRYLALGDAAPGTLGNVLFRFYRENGFAMPGEPRSFPEKFVLHELYHIFGSYPVTHQGEMLTAAFTGGNVEEMCMDMILLSLLQYQIGATVAGVSRGIPGQLDPGEFFHAVARGAAMRVNLMQEWDFWRVAHRPLDDLRQEYSLPPLRGSESFVPLPVATIRSGPDLGTAPG